MPFEVRGSLVLESSLADSHMFLLLQRVTVRRY
jgi:hypothetical protein